MGGAAVRARTARSRVSRESRGPRHRTPLTQRPDSASFRLVTELTERADFPRSFSSRLRLLCSPPPRHEATAARSPFPSPAGPPHRAPPPRAARRILAGARSPCQIPRRCVPPVAAPPSLSEKMPLPLTPARALSSPPSTDPKTAPTGSSFASAISAFPLYFYVPPCSLLLSGLKLRSLFGRARWSLPAWCPLARQRCWLSRSPD